MSFPSSPTNGQTYTNALGTQFIYNTAKGAWLILSGAKTRISGDVSTATPTPNADAQDTYTLSALAVGATFALPTGTPTDGQKMMLRIYDNGVQQTLAWNANYKVVGVTLPTTTTVGKYTYVGIVYNGVEGVWNVLAVGVES